MDVDTSRTSRKFFASRRIVGLVPLFIAIGMALLFVFAIITHNLESQATIVQFLNSPLSEIRVWQLLLAIIFVNIISK